MFWLCVCVYPWVEFWWREECLGIWSCSWTVWFRTRRSSIEYGEGKVGNGSLYSIEGGSGELFNIPSPSSSLTTARGEAVSCWDVYPGGGAPARLSTPKEPTDSRFTTWSIVVGCRKGRARKTALLMNVSVLSMWRHYFWEVLGRQLEPIKLQVSKRNNTDGGEAKLRPRFNSFAQGLSVKVKCHGLSDKISEHGTDQWFELYNTWTSKFKLYKSKKTTRGAVTRVTCWPWLGLYNRSRA